MSLVYFFNHGGRRAKITCRNNERKKRVVSRAGVIKQSEVDFDCAVVKLRRLAGSRRQGFNLTASLRRRGGQTRRAQMTSSFQKSTAVLRHHRLRTSSLVMSMTTSFMHDRDLLLLAMWSAVKQPLDDSALTRGRFFVMCGTLLSVVRKPHVFLPWEDDLDVTVLLEEQDEVEEFWTEVFPAIVKVVGFWQGASQAPVNLAGRSLLVTCLLVRRVASSCAVSLV